VRAWLELIELFDVERRKCQELSKGMQQKVQFLAAVIHDPELLVLDEPFSGLDPVNARVLDQVVRELSAAGKTILLSTHVMHHAERICSRVVLIHHGRKHLDASLDDVRARFDPRSVVYEPLRADAQLPARLAALRGVVGVRERDEGGGFDLGLAADADSVVLFAALAQLGPARRIELARVTLEEVFVRVVRAAEGSGAAQEAEEELARGKNT
jgi:ABC-2 type transport system ATP-binding protein